MPTVVTKTIGPTGRDYTTFTLAEAAVESIATAEFGGTDLVANDGAIVFEADAGTYTAGLDAYSSLVTDAARNVTYKNAAGSEHGGSAGAGVFIDTGALDAPIKLVDDFTVVDGFSLATTTTNCVWIEGSGTVVRNCISSASNRGFLVYGGSAGAPNILENCVHRGGTGHAFFVLGGGPQSADAHARVVNCTGSSTGNDAFRTQATASGTSATAEYINCAGLSTYTHQAVGSFTTVTGSNNVGGALNRWPVGTRLNGLFYTLTTSFSTPLGSGDYAVYMGSNGSLANVTGNDVWQQGVGPGSNSDVPTTDINGVVRSGATCNPGAFEADGFVAPTVTTQTIGPVGRDFASFTLAEASLPSEDITFTNRAFVFEADAGTYSEAVMFDSTLTADATRNVTYKPASGSEHGGVFGAGVRLLDNGSGYGGAQQVRDNFTVLDGLEVHVSNTSGFRNGVALSLTHDLLGVKLRNMLLWSQTQRTPLAAPSGGNFNTGSASAPIVFENLLIRKTDNFADMLEAKDRPGYEGHYIVTNCTFISDSAANYRAFSVRADTTLNLQITNTMSLVPWQWYQAGSGTLNLTGGNNFGGASLPLPVAIQSSPYPITASTAYDPGAGDFALYVGKNGALLDSPNNDVINGGVGPASNSDVPTTDILGDTRSGTTTNPGAFALAQATAVLTRTIGPVGRDYATFTAAEADVENIGGSADLVFENERIEFLADAATYSESVSFSSSLTTDATRNVTYRPASGSEHGGSLSAGVIVSGSSGNAAGLYDDFIHFEGIVVKSSASYAIAIGADGVTVDGLVLANTNAHVAIFQNGTALNPVRCLNCVAHATNGNGFYIFAPSTAAHVHLVNSTAVVSSGSYAIRAYGSAANLTLINHLGLVTSGAAYQAVASPTISGSNNFSISAGALPVAVQGSPYPITPTTNTTPGFGDYAIYEAATGALIVVDDNAALGGGVGPAANADVPVFDINGVKRIGGGCDPGAFEGVRSRSTDVWDVVTATHTTPGTFGELLHQVYLLTRTAAGGRIV